MRARRAVCDHYDLARYALLLILAVLALATYDSYAVSNDEGVQQRYGELILAYYASGFADEALFHYANLYLYGGLFDVTAVICERLLPFLDPYAVRHLLCAITGIAGVAATAATARLVAGARAGAIAAFVLAVCGTWYGAMFNHTKDIPFAAAMMGAAYFLCLATRGLPTPARRHVLGFGLLLGAALGIRVLGLLMVGYAGVAMLMRVYDMPRCSLRARVDFFAQSALALAPAFLIAYVIMIASWPWSALAPLNPLRGLIDFGAFHYQISTLFNGQVYEMGEVPRWYVPGYLLIKLPLLMLVGAGIASSFVLRGGLARRGETALLAFIAAFPVICEVIDRGPAFTGLRHFLFVVPAFAVLAGIGFDALLVRVQSRTRVVVGATIAAFVLWNASVLVRLHPYQYLYFNQLVGGVEGAARRFDMDYWVNVMAEAVNKLDAYVTELDKVGGHSRRYTVAVCGERVPFEERHSTRLQWTEDWKRSEFFIAPTHMDCDRALNGRVISTIARIGAPIGVIKDRRSLLQAEVASRP